MQRVTTRAVSSSCCRTSIASTAAKHSSNIGRAVNRVPAVCHAASATATASATARSPVRHASASSSQLWKAGQKVPRDSAGYSEPISTNDHMIDHGFSDPGNFRPPYRSPQEDPGVIARATMNTRGLFLDRPKALNALNLRMVDFITERLVHWDTVPHVQSIHVWGCGGKAFCAGGDVVAVYKQAKNGEDPLEFFRKEYKLNYQITRMSTPYIAVLNGITMGGGVGLSIHGQHRVAMGRSMFAMPETAIGFFPDVGGSFFLPRLKGQLGMFLALTGHRLKGADLVHAGIATCFADDQAIFDLENLLTMCETPDDVRMHMNFLAMDHDILPPFTLADRLADINECFSGDSVEEIFENLKAHDTEWSQGVLSTLQHMSPMALKITFRQMRHGASLSYEDAFGMEFRIARRFMSDVKTDFFEGVRALLIDKNKPQWAHKDVADVHPDFVEEFFAPIEDELDVTQVGHEPPTITGF